MCKNRSDVNRSHFQTSSFLFVSVPNSHDQLVKLLIARTIFQILKSVTKQNNWGRNHKRKPMIISGLIKVKKTSNLNNDKIINRDKSWQDKWKPNHLRKKLANMLKLLLQRWAKNVMVFWNQIQSRPLLNAELSIKHHHQHNPPVSMF